ncbi:MAG TPA: pyridoxamine 5'-phosphate oxidase family protein [Actinomycetota bacterium]|nr:pyridoxamine 5'-phosphate oxidase family protein [Actinomycetota bacterium]
MGRRASDQPLADLLLTTGRTLRLATVGPDGVPHVVPLWFVWWDGRVFMLSVTRSLKTTHARQGRWAAAVVDEGQEQAEVRDRRLVLHHLRGVEVRGPLSVAAGDPVIVEVARAWGRKYVGVEDFPPDGLRDHTWLCLEPRVVLTWDYGRWG